MRNRTPDLRIPSSDALPLSHRDSTVSKSKVCYEVHFPCLTLVKNISLYFFTELKTYNLCYFYLQRTISYFWPLVQIAGQLSKWSPRTRSIFELES